MHILFYHNALRYQGKQAKILCCMIFPHLLKYTYPLVLFNNTHQLIMVCSSSSVHFAVHHQFFQYFGEVDKWALLVRFSFGLTVGIRPSKEQNEIETHYCHSTDEGNETKRVSGESRGKRVCVNGVEKLFHSTSQSRVFRIYLVTDLSLGQGKQMESVCDAFCTEISLRILRCDKMKEKRCLITTP